MKILKIFLFFEIHFFYSKEILSIKKYFRGSEQILLIKKDISIDNTNKDRCKIISFNDQIRIPFLINLIC